MRLPRTLLSTIGLLAMLTVARIEAQVGKGLLDLNQLSEKELAMLPNITPAAAKAIASKQPFATIVDFNTFVMGQGLTQEQATAIYEKAFIPLNLNTTTGPEILLVPKIAKRMTREFEEYRPWTSWAQFDSDIGKYVKAQPGELERLKMYVFIPINANTAADDVLMTIPGMTQATLNAIKQGRPWKTQAQFEQAIGKVVPAKEVARIWRYLTL
jgi:DNA uptake protein ComE-like DNA-binding protein